MKKTVLILGASGRFGRNAVSSFSWAGWDLRQFDRKTDSLAEAAWGADLIVNAWNPPYPDWAREVPRFTQEVIQTARDTGSAVLIPGNIYVYGQAMPETLTENTPHRATNPLGRVRIDMEQAYRQSGVKTIILRGGDFIDTAPSGNWFDKILTAKSEAGVFTYPGDPDVAHAWAFLPDMTDMAVALAEQLNTLGRYTEVCAPGFTLTGRELVEAIAKVTARPQRLTQMSWLPITLARPFWPLGRSLLEMRYLWNTPHHLAPGAMASLLPDFVPTSLEDALAASLQHQIDPDRLMRRPRAKVAGLLSTFNARCGHSQAG
ncbi:MAG: epimerase [Pseudomonadota bacterium]